MPSYSTSGVAKAADVRGSFDLRTVAEHPSSRPEIVMWRNVVLLALHDLAGDGSGNSQGDRSKARNLAFVARRWLSTRDFLLVCDYADLNPESVRKVAKEIDEIIERDGHGGAFFEGRPGGTLSARKRAAREAKERAEKAEALLGVRGS